MDMPLAPPQPPQRVRPPTLQALYASLDPFSFWYLKSVISSRLQYEHHVYGPFNVYLQGIFPSWRRFAVIPQALIRRVMDIKDIDENLANVSIGSAGGLHESRDLSKSSAPNACWSLTILLPAGVEVEKSFPDFVVVRVKAYPGGAREHYIVTVIEVKKDPIPNEAMHEQMVRYMARVADLPNRQRNIKGYLVTGHRATPYTINDDTAEIVEGRTIDIFAPGDPLTTSLCNAAIRHWNEQ